MKAGYPEDVEEAVTHHAGDGIIYTEEALPKPRNAQKIEKNEAIH